MGPGLRQSDRGGYQMPDRNKTKDRDPKDEADETKRKDEAARWKEENAAAIEAFNEWVKREGLPFAKYRRF
jgi:hypothetical protein